MPLLGGRTSVDSPQTRWATSDQLGGRQGRGPHSAKCGSARPMSTYTGPSSAKLARVRSKCWGDVGHIRALSTITGRHGPGAGEFRQLQRGIHQIQGPQGDFLARPRIVGVGFEGFCCRLNTLPFSHSAAGCERRACGRVGGRRVVGGWVETHSNLDEAALDLAEPTPNLVKTLERLVRETLILVDPSPNVVEPAPNLIETAPVVVATPISIDTKPNLGGAPPPHVSPRPCRSSKPPKICIEESPNGVDTLLLPVEAGQLLVQPASNMGSECCAHTDYP